MQPGEPFGSGQRDHRPVRAVHHHGFAFGSALFTERIAVMPHRAGVGGTFGSADS
jgi:hypothetical protein